MNTIFLIPGKWSAADVPGARASRRLGVFGAVGDAKSLIPFAKLPDWFGKVERVNMPPISRVIRRSGRSV